LVAMCALLHISLHIAVAADKWNYCPIHDHFSAQT
jgi:hypothetical protein